MSTTLDGLLPYLTVGAAVGCGLIAGVFFAFSAFVMPALARLPAPRGIAAMQSINVAAITPSFMSALFGTGVACGLLAVSSLASWRRPGAGYILLGSLLYVGGSLFVTMAFNVPRNNALAAVDAGSAEGAAVWSSYLASWTAWNHVRTAAALAAAVLLTVALRLPP